jgi:hypothetical protein
MGNETGSATEPSTLCSRCVGATIPIAYGLLDADLFDAAEREEVELAGCIIPDNPPPDGAGRAEPVSGNRR